MENLTGIELTRDQVLQTHQITRVPAVCEPTRYGGAVMLC